MCRYDVLLGHHLVDKTTHVALETKVAVRHDAYEHAVVVNYGYATNLVLLHKLQGIAHGVILADGHGVVYHATLGTLHATYVRSLCRNRHILVNHTYATLTCQCYGQGRLCYGVHRCGHNGYVELNIAREATHCRHLAR